MSRKRNKRFKLRDKKPRRASRLERTETFGGSSTPVNRAVQEQRHERVFTPKLPSPKTENQARLIEAIRRNDITISIGCAGTGKTHLAIGVAVALLRANSVDHILISRPLVGAGEDSGALPGTDKQKILPYLRPLFDELKQFASHAEIAEWQNPTCNSLEIVPIQFMRGRTFKNSAIIVDEAQNATYEQLKMIMSRLGEGSRLIIVGDPDQTDLPPRLRGGLDKCVNALSDPEEEGCTIVRLTNEDIVRHPIVRKIMERLP